MKGSEDSALKQRLKELIVTECEKEIAPESIADEAVLFEDEALELDSMDALQISMGLQKHFGIEISDSKKLRKVMVSINTLADHIQPE